VNEERLTGEPEGRELQRDPLFPDAQPLDQTSVSLEIVAFEIVEKASALADQHEKPAAGVMILNVDLEVPREVVDPLTQQGNLNLRGAGVGRMEFIALENLFPLLLSDPHLSFVHLLSFFKLVNL
jgi:hypothetical protein